MPRSTSSLATWPCSRTGRPTPHCTSRRPRRVGVGGAVLDGRPAASVRAILSSGQCDAGREPRRLEGRTVIAGSVAAAGAGQSASAAAAGQGPLQSRPAGRGLQGVAEGLQGGHAHSSRRGHVGLALREGREFKKAEEWMDYAAKTSPDSLPVHVAVTAWLLEQGRAEEAQSHAEAAAKLDSKSNQSNGCSGWCPERKEWSVQAIFQALALGRRRRLGARPTGLGPWRAG